MTAIYTAEALATGDGRNGYARTSDGKIDVALDIPKEMGGSGVGTNPEQLFATGYAACFLGALKLVARQKKVTLPDDTSITAKVGIGPNDEGGFELNVVLEISLPHLAPAEAQTIAEKAHLVCPYSNATRGNIDVQITLADD